MSMGRNTVSCDPEDEFLGMIKKEIIDVKIAKELEQ